MAHFYGSMSGARGERTCCGTKNSGIVAHIRGWNLGVRVVLEHDNETGQDKITVMQTGGSNSAHVPSKTVEFTGEQEDSSHAPDCTYRLGHMAECNCQRSEVQS